jgi:translocation and assembly module TamB
VLASDTRDLRAVIDPDVTVRYAAGQPLNITGTVGVPSASLDLERLDEGVSASDDVVVLDPVDPKRDIAAPLDLDLTLALGDDVNLNGFGLDGTLGGRLRVRQRPGREMTANGTLDVAGRYTAYGQKLDITRGELAWTNNAIGNPALDIRAERQVGRRHRRHPGQRSRDRAAGGGLGDSCDGRIRSAGLSRARASVVGRQQ